MGDVFSCFNQESRGRDSATSAVLGPRIPQSFCTPFQQPNTCAHGHKTPVVDFASVSEKGGRKGVKI